MTQLGPYSVHPIADLFPLLDGDEFDELVRDIEKNGLQQPIVLTADELTLVDGRNRYRACIEASVDPVFRVLPARYGEAGIVDYILTANVHRRHLTPGQLAMIGAQLVPVFAEQARQRQIEGGARGGRANGKVSADLRSPSGLSEKTSERAAAAVGASARGVEQATAVLRDAPDLAEAVQAGTLALDAADKQRKARQKGKPKPAPVVATPVTLTLMTHEGVEVAYPKPKSKATFNETTGEGISWAAWSWNPVTGCLHGCEYCYAREIATATRYEGAYPVGFTPLFHHERLDAPLNTTIPAAHRGDPAYRRVFVCSMADLYGKWVPKEWIARVHDAMAAAPDWEYLLLTKFPSRYARVELPPRAWVGTSVDTQRRVSIAEQAFAKIEGVAVKWLSLEPLREPLRFNDLSMFDWVVIGAQTQTVQPDGIVPAFAPPFEWVANIVAQAREAGCRVHLKPNLRSGPGMDLPDEYPSSVAP